MKCLHGLNARYTTTKNGTFWLCEQEKSCEFFCPDEDRDTFTKAIEAFSNTQNIHPTCPDHQKLAKLCIVKDEKKANYGRPFFVCSSLKNPCKFWEWGDVPYKPKPICSHKMVCRKLKVKKDGPNKDRMFFRCPMKDNDCGFFEWEEPVNEDDNGLFERGPKPATLYPPRLKYKKQAEKPYRGFFEPINEEPIQPDSNPTEARKEHKRYLTEKEKNRSKTIVKRQKTLDGYLDELLEKDIV